MGADLTLSYLPVKTTVVELRTRIIENIKKLTYGECEEILGILADCSLVDYEMYLDEEDEEGEKISERAVKDLLFACACEVDENLRTNATMMVGETLIIITGGESWGDAPGNVDSFEILSAAGVADE